MDNKKYIKKSALNAMSKYAKWKKILIGIGIFAVVITGLDFLRIAYFPTDIEKFDKAVKEFEQGLQGYYKSDVYGGETPEITYNLFVGALKNGNTELASKYFFLSDWDKKQAEFKEKKEKGELEEYIANLPKWEELEERQREEGVKEYIYTVIFNKDVVRYNKLIKKDIILKAGNKYAGALIFKKNINNIWKIYEGF